jgi:hypothetical protein
MLRPILLLFALATLAHPAPGALAASALSIAVPVQPTQPVHPVHPAQQDVELEKRKTEAGNDVTKLWKLYEWCRETKRDKDGKAILRKIVKLDPLHKDANVALGHLFHDGKWFTTQKQLDEYKQAQDLAEKKAQGLVQWKDQWVPAEDVPYLERGLVRDANGDWSTPEDAQKLAEGWTRQDLEWVSPEEKSKLEAGLWKCGDEWLSLADADEYHADLAAWWRIPYPRFHLYTTRERDYANDRIKRELENAYDELVRAYGGPVPRPIRVVVLRDKDQYSQFANGDEAAGRNTTDARGFSSVHHAYFADQNFEVSAAGPVFGVGVGYWDTASTDGPKWGVHSVRHALGLSFAEALDPSTKTLEKHAKSPMRAEALWDAFYAEKRIPAWFMYGAAAYAERYYRDTTVDAGGDPLWARKWSVSNIQARGGLRQLKQILDFDLTVEGGADSEKLINEAGLLVAYLLDGGNAALAPKFAKFQEAVRTAQEKKAVADATKALETELLKHEDALKAFAGL